MRELISTLRGKKRGGWREAQAGNELSNIFKKILAGEENATDINVPSSLQFPRLCFPPLPCPWSSCMVVIVMQIDWRYNFGPGNFFVTITILVILVAAVGFQG